MSKRRWAWRGLASAALAVAVGCSSPTAPAPRILGTLATEDFLHAFDPEKNAFLSQEEGRVRVRIITQGRCPIESPEIEVIRTGAHVVILPYERRLVDCPLQVGRILELHHFVHDVEIDLTATPTESVGVLAVDANGQAVEKTWDLEPREVVTSVRTAF